MTITPLSIALGRSAGYKTFQAVGYSATIVAAAPSMLGPALGDVATTTIADANRIHLLDTPATLEVTRADQSDTGLVTVSYLDDQLRERVAVYQMDAATKSTTVGNATITATRVIRARYEAGGNVGQIDLKIGGNLASRIGSDEGRSNVCLFTVPYGQIVVQTSVVLTSQSGKPVSLKLWARPPGKKPFLLAHFPSRETLESIEYPIPHQIRDVDFTDPQNPALVMAGIDLYLTAQRPPGGDTAEVSASLSFLAQQTGLDPDAPGFTTTSIVS